MTARLSPLKIFSSLLPGLLLAALSAYCFHVILQHHWPDLYDHVLLYQGPWDERVQSHVLFFLLLRVFSFSSASQTVIFNALTVLLVLAVLARWWVLKRWLSGQVPQVGILLPFIAFCLCLVHPIPFRYPQMYLGQITGNSWHNSTVILLVPLALLQYSGSLALLEKFDSGRARWLGLLAVAGCLAKPNFFMVYLICFPLMVLLVRRPWNARQAWRYLAHLLPALLLLGIEYTLVFSGRDSGGAGIAFTPFLVWDHYVTSKTLALLTSLAFPLAFILAYPATILKSRDLQFAWLLFGTGLLLFIALSETGPRQFHGNFMWQLMPCTLILFSATMVQLLKGVVAKNNSIFHFRNVVLFGLFFLHVVSGIAYILKIPRAGIW
jgi:hypothetical protein